MTLHATIDLARRVDRAEIDFCAIAGSTAASGVESLDAGGGRALYSTPGSPLNKMLGLGLSGPVSEEDLDRVEAFYAQRQCPAQIELCPLGYSDVAARLCARGFVVQGYENQLGCRLPAPDCRPPDGIDVRRTTADEDKLWGRVVAEGFVAAESHVGGGPAAEMPAVEQLEGMMAGFTHQTIRLYLAFVDGQAAGGGAAWLHEGLLGINGTATKAAFRRRGIQAAVTLKTMQDAPDADLATASVAPGSTSQRTFERLGFQVLYTRTVFVKA